MNSKRKGSLAIAAAISYFVGKGVTVLVPLADCDKYDLAIDQGGVLKKVQCKYTDDKEDSGAFIVDLRTFGGYRGKTHFIRYNLGDFDLLFALCSDKKQFLIPIEKILNMSKISVGIKSWNEYIC